MLPCLTCTGALPRGLSVGQRDAQPRRVRSDRYRVCLSGVSTKAFILSVCISVELSARIHTLSLWLVFPFSRCSYLPTDSPHSTLALIHSTHITISTRIHRYCNRHIKFHQLRKYAFEQLQVGEIGIMGIFF